MKKIKIVFVLALCFVSFGIARADTLIIKSTDKRIEDIEKSREKLDKDNETNYKQLQAELKSLSAKIDGDIKSNFTCVKPAASCDETTYQRIKGIAISSGLTPDANQLAQCRTQIDEYNQKLQKYNQCFQDWQNQKIGYSAGEEYEYQLRVYELKSELACMDKEGYYSSFNKKTKKCECVAGSTFINGKCKSNLDNLLLCVKSFGSLSSSDGKGACVCEEGSEFDWNNNGLCTKKQKTLTENRYIPVAERQNTPKTITPSQQEKTVLGAKTTEEIAPKSATKPEAQVAQPQNNQIPANTKTTFWQRLKNNILKIKFW